MTPHHGGPAGLPAGERSVMPLLPSVPHSARVWNYWLGGKDNFAADRALGAQIAQACPDITAITKESRRFLARAVRHLAWAGIEQFLDIGTGLPGAGNTHEVAQQVNSRARIVYVDNNPLVLAHARALLTSGPQGATHVLDADVHDPDTVLRAATKILNFGEPIALMMLDILGTITDYHRARTILDRLATALPSGSYVVVNDGTNVINPDARNEATRLSIKAGAPYIARHPDDIAGFLDGLDIITPGVVSSSRWRPEPGPTPAMVDAFCGVARKP